MEKSHKSSEPKSKSRMVYSAEFKRSVVEKSFAAGASIRLIARRNAISPSALYQWRLAHLAESGNRGSLAPAHQQTDITSGSGLAGLLPVQMVDESSLQSAAGSDKQTNNALCEVEFDRARLRLRGEVSPSMVRLLIQELSR